MIFPESMKQGLILACALAVLPCAAQEKPSPDALYRDVYQDGAP